MAEMTEEFELGGQFYTVAKMDARTQLKLVKRLAPMLKAVLSRSEEVMVASILSALNELKDDDLDYVLDLCMLYAKRKNPQGAWVPVFIPGGGLMHDDLRMDPMLQLELAGKVIQADLGGFFRAVGQMISKGLPTGSLALNSSTLPTERTGSLDQ